MYDFDGTVPTGKPKAPTVRRSRSVGSHAPITVNNDIPRVLHVIDITSEVNPEDMDADVRRGPNARRILAKPYHLFQQVFALQFAGR